MNIMNFYPRPSCGLIDLGEELRGKIEQVETENDEHGYANQHESRGSRKPRIDLNDLLERIKAEKKVDKKINLIIVSGAASVAIVTVLLLSL